MKKNSLKFHTHEEVIMIDRMTWDTFYSAPFFNECPDSKCIL
jgi:hypothetical protein